MGKEAHPMTLDPMAMDGLLLATGFTGGWTFVWLLRCLGRALFRTPKVSAAVTPGPGCTEAVISELKDARREILVQAPALTSRPIAEALVAAKLRGLKVEVLLDRKSEQDPASQLKYLLEQGLAPMVLDRVIAQHQAILIDSRVVLTGSLGLTPRSDGETPESCLAFRDHTEALAGFRQTFDANLANAEEPK